jgi:tRNA (mo5U34)-methyltransferase
MRGIIARRLAVATPPALEAAAQPLKLAPVELLEQARDRERLAREIASHDWYHTLELAPGLLTPGWFDTRPVVAKLPLPASLAGRRCLDIGTFDGFWAFELERRGAAEVVAIDILDPAGWDWPAGSEAHVVEQIGERKARGAGFELACAALGSSVRRVERSVYALDPAVDGNFDFVYLGSLLLHLRDPVAALARVRGVCTGELLVVDAIDLGLTLRHPRRPQATLDGRGRPWWWKPNVAALARMLEAAGFEAVSPPVRLAMPPGSGTPRPRLRLDLLRSAAGREALLRSRYGDPHAALLARPRA